MEPKKLVIHAPNIHTGGGLQLLNAVLAAGAQQVRYVQCDARAAGRLALPAGCEHFATSPTLAGRVEAEWRLRQLLDPSDVVLCFHSLPPLFATRARVVVFVHSRLVAGSDSLADYPLFVQARVTLERLWLRTLRYRAACYVVQTASMAAALKMLVGNKVEVVVAPCVPAALTQPIVPAAAGKQYDFVYVASGETHKNHRRLMEAWILLAQAGITPSLALTVDAAREPVLARDIERMIVQYGLRVVNLGALAPEQVGALYQVSGALIFPSVTESFGLPLVEAAHYGLPILASELDFVRDVVVPAASFDPHSALSIARAVRRFMGCAEPVVVPQAAEQFIAAVLR
jgi:glycosyltransferase involved in cell wall biosynthesis